MLEVMWRDHPAFVGWYVADCGEMRLVASPIFWAVFDFGEKMTGPPMHHGRARDIEAAKEAYVKAILERLDA